MTVLINGSPVTSRRSLPPVLIAHGFSLMKRRILRRFVAPSKVTFVRRGEQIPSGATLVLWGSASVPQNAPCGLEVFRVEDGFLRSVGLGAEMARPLSWVIDGSGIYYDPSRPSDLEEFLQTMNCPAALLERAATLRRRIVGAGITKYGVGNRAWRRPDRPGRVVLVVGQVETDASLRLGAPTIRSNWDLVQEVRRAHPQDFLVYKPHPDVVARLRSRDQNEAGIDRLCDEVVTQTSIDCMLRQVDVVHVATSLTGFEALLRGIPVVCHGQPFYAGWGLTSDVDPLRRRTRKLSLDQLVAGTLIVYPRYSSRTTSRRISPELALEELVQWTREDPRAGPFTLPLWRALLRIAVTQP